MYENEVSVGLRTMQTNPSNQRNHSICRIVVCVSREGGVRLGVVAVFHNFLLFVRGIPSANRSSRVA